MRDKLVIYSFAHSNPKGGAGASTLKGVCERAVSRTAFVPFQDRLQQEGIKVQGFAGPLGAKIRIINKAIDKAKEDKALWASVALHFNQTPLEQCPGCGKSKNMGAVCLHCKTPSPKNWRFGHTVEVFRFSEASICLAESIQGKLSLMLPWSEARPLIRVPDKRFPRSIWARTVQRPAALVEIGFGCDIRFSDWIESTDNQAAYGLAAAEALIDWFEKRESMPEEIPLEYWGD